MKIFIVDLFELLLSVLRINKLSIYKELIVLSSISLNLRRPKNKFSIKNSLKILFLYSMLIKRILGIYNFKNIFLFKNYFHNRCIDCDIVLVYPDNDKWILKGISEDLKSNLKNQSLNVKSIPAKQLFRYLSSKNILFISHPLACKEIKKFPNILSKSSIYLTHLRTADKFEIELISRFKYVFCQSNLDQMRLSSLGFLPGRVISFPVGVDENIFFKIQDFKQREYDFLFSIPYKIDNKGSHYWLRKSTPVLVEVIKNLASKGYKIMLLGDNWEYSKFINIQNITIKTPSYTEKNYFINQCKCFINLSILEGGPVTILEALASGCLCISKNCGIAHQLSNDFKESFFLIENYISPQKLTNVIEEYYLEKIKNHYISTNIQKIKKYSFNNLSSKLKKVIT